LNDPNYLINECNQVNFNPQSGENTSGEFEVDFNHEEKRKNVPKSAPQTYYKDMNLVNVRNDGKPKQFSLWTRKQLPPSSRVAFMVIHSNSDKRNKPIAQCSNHSAKHSVGSYIIPSEEMWGSNTCQKGGHYIIAVPTTSLDEKVHEPNVKTGEQGYGYTGKFYLPCYTSDISDEKKGFVILVASLEVPCTAYMGGEIPPQDLMGMYHNVGMATINVRVSSTPGREVQDLRRDSEPSSSSNREPVLSSSDDKKQKGRKRSPALLDKGVEGCPTSRKKCTQRSEIPQVLLGKFQKMEVELRERELEQQERELELQERKVELQEMKDLVYQLLSDK
jgi:hypothetical protein